MFQQEDEYNETAASQRKRLQTEIAVEETADQRRQREVWIFAVCGFDCDVAHEWGSNPCAQERVADEQAVKKEVSTILRVRCVVF
jgi:hypothetical protein